MYIPIWAIILIVGYVWIITKRTTPREPCCSEQDTNIVTKNYGDYSDIEVTFTPEQQASFEETLREVRRSYNQS